jgi:carboxylesterase type B
MIAQSLTKNNGKNPVYRYRFNHLPNNTTTPARGISTGAEQSYIFSNLVPKHPWDQALAYEMTSAWVSFTYNLNPNPGGG